MASADERDLLSRAKQGDSLAFAELVRQYQTTVFNVAFRMLGRRQDAEDAAQESFLRAYRAMDSFDESLPFAPWIRRIATNVCLNWLESSRVKPHFLASDLGSEETGPADMGQWAHPGPGPEQSMMTQERMRQTRRAILQLPPHYRAVIELRHYQEMSYDEIADALDRSLSNVKSDLFRARKLLAGMLQGDE
jgi:RNA polymerase sigma-70 factor (ECF subfamily)